MIKTVGVSGLGRLELAIAQRPLGSGFSVIGYDIDHWSGGLSTDSDIRVIHATSAVRVVNYPRFRSLAVANDRQSVNHTVNRLRSKIVLAVTEVRADAAHQPAITKFKRVRTRPTWNPPVTAATPSNPDRW